MQKTAVYLVLTLLIASTLPLSVNADQSQDIPTNAAGTGIHNSLVAALSHANLVGTLGGPGPFTVFAPTDQAFTDAGIDLNDFDTPEENATLTQILLHHVVAGSVPAADVKDGMMATTVNGDKIKFTVSNGAVSIGAAQVTMPDVLASNGIIHVIDKVLTPPADIPATAQTTGIHTSLVAAIIQAELLTTLEGNGPFTVFAPTDQAFADAGIDLASLNTAEGKATLSDILLYHVVASDVPAKNVTDCMLADAANGQKLSFTVGDTVMVNDANITLTDVISSNGLIHVIDKVLMPTDSPRDIPRTAQCTGNHDSLVAGVLQAELLETLQGPGPFTVFAPTDQAFIDAGIDFATVPLSTLSDILLYHVHAGTVLSSDLTEGMTLPMVNGKNATISLVTGIDGANITTADVVTSNGVIHVIDKVIIPQAEVDPTATGDGVEADEEDDDNLVLILSIVGAVVLLGAIGGLLFVRGRRQSSGAETKDFAQEGLNTIAQPATTYSYETQQAAQQTYTSQYAPQQSSPFQPVQVEQVQPVQAAAQPVAQVQAAQPAQAVTQTQVSQAAVQLPEVLQQWTDDSGYTWRRMSDGSTMWWNGTDWQNYA